MASLSHTSLYSSCSCSCSCSSFDNVSATGAAAVAARRFSRMSPASPSVRQLPLPSHSSGTDVSLISFPGYRSQKILRCVTGSTSQAAAHQFSNTRQKVHRKGYLVAVNLSKNGAANSVNSSVMDLEREAEINRAAGERRQFFVGGDSAERGINDETSTGAPCTRPNFPNEDVITILNPLGSLSGPEDGHRPILLYVPGMDCTGQGIRSQLCYLVDAGYDIRCVYIPSTDRSSWQQLVEALLPLLIKEVRAENGQFRPLTVLGESFGGGLAMRLAKAAPYLVTSLVVINSATNFSNDNPLGSFIARTGLLALFPPPLYEVAQDILLPMIVKRNRVSATGAEDFLSPLDYVPAACAAWRMSLLNDRSGLVDDDDWSLITMPTLLIASAKDRLMSSLAEGARLQSLLPNARRVVLPESGHTPLYEDSINIADIMLANGFAHPASTYTSRLNLTLTPSRPLAKRQEAVPDDIMDELGRVFEPWRILTSPLVSGVENLPIPSSEPRRPLLFVGNHTMFGIYDSPVLVYELYLRGFRCRGLAHPGHWRTGVGEIFARYGNVKATKVAAYKLLKEGENVLLFPGGAKEVCKKKGEQYKLLWKENTDFVRMAVRHNAIIVPFGALGGDDAYDIIYDRDDLKASPIWPLTERLYGILGIDPDNAYPITAIPGTKIPSSFIGSPFTVPNSIERIYFHFAEPFDSRDYASSLKDRDQMRALYEMVKTRVENSIEHLKRIRSNDPERELPVRLLAKLGRLLPDLLPRVSSNKPDVPGASNYGLED